MTQHSPIFTRIKGFDGLRALSALGVVLHHATPLHTYIGDLSVFIFFTLSGALIIEILRSSRLRIENGESRSSTEWLKFWISRIFRIFPVYYIALLILYIYSCTKNQHQAFLHAIWWYIAYLQNIHIGLVSMKWEDFTHLWSLGVEQQFYVGFSIILIFTPYKIHRLILVASLAICALTYIWLARNMSNISAYVLPPLGFVFILSGGLVTFLKSSWWGALPKERKDLFLTTLIFCILYIATRKRGNEGVWSKDIPVSTTAISIMLASLSGMLIWQILHSQESKVVAALENKILIELGKLSYAIYVFHSPLIHVAEEQTNHLHIRDGFRNWSIFLLTMIFTLAISKASYLLVEYPLMQRKKRVIARLSPKKIDQ